MRRADAGGVTHEADAPPVTPLEGRFRQLFDTAPQGMALLDTEGRVRVSNAALEALARCGPGALLGRSVGALLAAGSRPAWTELVASVRHRRRPVAPLVAVPARPATPDARWELHCRTVRAEDRPPSLVLQVADVTERLRAEARLATAARMEVVGRLAGGVAHDFNNLLTAILGSVAAAREVALPEAALTELAVVEGAAERGAALVRQLLAFARQQTLAPRTLDLAEAVGAAALLLRRMLGPGVRLDLRLERPGPHVRVDPGQLDQVLLNLAANARDAMPEGGVLRITTMPVIRAAAADGVPAGRYAALEVADTGRGIPPQVLPRIWEPFFTTQPERGGTGLGLASVAGILAQSGGHASVVSELGLGTTFTILLPMAEGLPEAPATALADPARAARGVSVLLVEDEPTLLRLAGRVLRAAGHRVREAASAEAALDGLDAAEVPELLVSDVAMPGLDGLTLARRLRERWPTLPVLLLSGYAVAVVGRDLAGEGVGLLAKPFTPDALLQAVRNGLATPRTSGPGRA